LLILLQVNRNNFYFKMRGASYAVKDKNGANKSAGSRERGAGSDGKHRGAELGDERVDR
jgi:hypothetical protein